MYTELMQSVVEARADSCPRCSGELNVALPGSADIERVCICRSCSAVITIDDYKVNGMNEVQDFPSSFSHRRPTTA